MLVQGWQKPRFHNIAEHRIKTSETQGSIGFKRYKGQYLVIQNTVQSLLKECLISMHYTQKDVKDNIEIFY